MTCKALSTDLIKNLAAELEIKESEVGTVCVIKPDGYIAVGVETGMKVWPFAELKDPWDFVGQCKILNTCHINISILDAKNGPVAIICPTVDAEPPQCLISQLRKTVKED